MIAAILRITRPFKSELGFRRLETLLPAGTHGRNMAIHRTRILAMENLANDSCLLIVSHAVMEASVSGASGCQDARIELATIRLGIVTSGSRVAVVASSSPSHRP